MLFNLRHLHLSVFICSYKQIHNHTLEQPVITPCDLLGSYFQLQEVKEIQTISRK